METKFYIDASGKYLGGYAGAAPPAGAIEVPAPPDHALKQWNGTAWVSPAAYDTAIRDGRLAAHDAAGLPRPSEDLWVLMLAKKLIARPDIPIPIINPINAKRVMRGEPPL